MAGLKISQLSSSLAPSLTGVTPVVLGDVTYKSTLQSLRQVLVDSGSHVFTGSQVIKGDLIVSGSVTAQQYILSSSITNITTETISGSSNFGNSLDDRHRFTGSVLITGSLHTNNIQDDGNLYVSGFVVIGNQIPISDANTPKFHLTNSGSFNIAHFEANNEYYAQINITNKNSGSLASSDLVLTSDNGDETVHFVNLGVNSSTYNGGYVGYENDAYLLNVGKDLYIGTVGGTSHPAELKLFANNSWETPQITLHTGSEVSFNTSSVTEGYTYEFSGSIKLQNELTVNGSVTASYFIGDGSQLTNLPNGLGETDVSMFLSSSAFNSFTSSYFDTSASFDSRINAATNEQNISDLATTGSNTFVGEQTFNELINIKSVTEEISFNNNIIGDAEFNFNSGSIIYLSGLTSNGNYNVYNIPEINNKATTLTFVIEQGSTPYSGSAYYINGTQINVKWVDNIIPTGSANKTEVIGLTAFRVNSSWNVLGSMSTFG